MLIQSTSNQVAASIPAGTSSSTGLVGITVQQKLADTPKVQEKQTAAQATAAQVKNDVNKINRALQQANKNVELSFSVDKATNRQVITLVDKDTGDKVLQIPSEAVLAISQGIDDFQQGLLVRQKA